MKIIIHRGTHEIGGCATEICTENTRILIDFGARLQVGHESVSFENLRIEGLNVGKPSFDAVLLTHYHADHLGLIAQIPNDIPIYLEKNAILIYLEFSNRMGEKNTYMASRFCPLDAFKPIEIGDMHITPLPADHSAFGAMMFLIRANGKSVLHTGDFRLHGFRSRYTLDVLKQYAKNISVLITEGTQLTRNSDACISEKDLQREERKIIRNNKYVFVACASTNIDRLAAFYHAVPKGRYFICDDYQKHILDIVSSQAKSRWYHFLKVHTYGQNLMDRLQRNGFVMPVRANKQFREIVPYFPDSVLIYSMWKGYLDGRFPVLSDFIRPFEKRGQFVYLHTSGHVTPDGLKKVFKMVNPAVGIIPIHSEKPEKLLEICGDYPVFILQDREQFFL